MGGRAMKTKNQSPLNAILWMDEISEDMRLQIFMERMFFQLKDSRPKQTTLKYISKSRERRVVK